MDKNPVNFGRIAIAICLASDIVVVSPLASLVFKRLFLVAKCLNGEIYEWKNVGKSSESCLEKKKHDGGFSRESYASGSLSCTSDLW